MSRLSRRVCFTDVERHSRGRPGPMARPSPRGRRNQSSGRAAAETRMSEYCRRCRASLESAPSPMAERRCIMVHHPCNDFGSLFLAGLRLTRGHRPTPWKAHKGRPSRRREKQQKHKQHVNPVEASGCEPRTTGALAAAHSLAAQSRMAKLFDRTRLPSFFETSAAGPRPSPNPPSPRFQNLRQLSLRLSFFACGARAAHVKYVGRTAGL